VLEHNSGLPPRRGAILPPGNGSVPDSGFLLELILWFSALTSAGFGNPIPEEVMLVSAGVRTSQMSESYLRWLMVPVCFAGAVMSDVILYGLGFFFGGKLLRWHFMRRLAPPEKQERIRQNLDRYGMPIFIVGRLVPGIRTTMFLTAGATRLSLFRFVVADGAGAVLGVAIFFSLGYALGAQFEELFWHIEQQITPYKPILLLTLLFAVAGYLVYAFFRHPIPTGDPEEVPLIGHQLAVHLPTKDSDSRVTPAAAPEKQTAGAAPPEARPDS
jgi:membrane protein DedA with SNARE-associated domain